MIKKKTCCNDWVNWGNKRSNLQEASEPFYLHYKWEGLHSSLSRWSGAWCFARRHFRRGFLHFTPFNLMELGQIAHSSQRQNYETLWKVDFFFFQSCSWCFSLECVLSLAAAAAAAALGCSAGSNTVVWNVESSDAVTTPWGVSGRRH